jgi:hypothetical protein
MQQLLRIYETSYSLYPRRSLKTHFKSLFAVSHCMHRALSFGEQLQKLDLKNSNTALPETVKVDRKAFIV